jgi:uncharacterized protein (DUF302 family)
VVTNVSPRSVRETVARFSDLLSAKGVRLFAVIDQADEARRVGLDLRETVLVLFGNPKAGTPVMVASIAMSFGKGCSHEAHGNKKPW